MKISTEIFSTSKIVGERKAIEYIAKAGFDGWDFSLFNMARYDWTNKTVIESDHPLRSNNAIKFAKELRKIGEDNGIKCNQSHAPFPTCVKAIRDTYKKAIECTAEAGGSICIIHPDNDASCEENTEMYFELLPFAKEHNVKIATENMWNWDYEKSEALICACSDKKNFCEQMDAIKDDYFVACLDIGHAEMKGLNTSAVELIKALNSRIGALHIHDNDLWHDSHNIPFSMKIDFNAVVKELKRINYNGWFTLEADAYLGYNKYTAENVFEGVKNLADSAKKLVDLYEKTIL